MTEGVMRLVFVGQFVEEKVTLKNNYYSQAGNLYQKKFIDISQPEKAISIIPIFDKEEVNYSYHYRDSVFVFSRKRLSIISNLVNLLTVTYKSFLIIKGCSSSFVWFYNLNKSTFLLALAVKLLLRRKKLAIIVADFVRAKRFTIQWLINFLISKFHTGIVLTSSIKVVPNSQLLPGLLYDKDITLVRKEGVNRNVLLSGSLGKTTGFELALDFFKANSSYCLYITGRPFRYDNLQFHMLLDEIRCCPNIHFLGLLNYEDYLQVLDKCDIALSLRDPNDSDHEYNFPSKILEYLSRGKFVISSRNYPDLPGDLIFLTDFTTDGLRSCMESILNLDGPSALERRARIYAELTASFSESALKRVLRNCDPR